MMNNRDKLDDLFRNGLDGYRVEPSEGLWKIIESRFFPSSGMRRIFGITSIIILLLAGSTLLTWYVPSGRSVQAPENETSISAQTPDAERSEMTSHFTDVTQKENTTSSEYEEYNFDMSSHAHEMASHESIIASKTKNPGQEKPSGSERKYSQPDSEIQHGSSTYNHFTEAIFMGRRAGLIYQPMALSMEDLSLRELSPGLPIYKTLKNEYARKYEMHAGASFMPTVLYYNPNPNNTGWSAAADVSYSRSWLKLYAGMGVSRFKDKGTWQVHYESYDSVGYYTNITSFRMHPEQPGKIIFETAEVTVYDSVPHVSIEERSNRYTYIDIPVAVGLNAVNARRFSLTVKAGVKFSILAGKDEPEVNPEMAGSAQNEIIREVPARTPTTWRFTAGVEASYLLTGRMSLYLEPAYEQYLRSVYKDMEGYQPNKPYLIGVNIGARLRVR